MIKSLYYLLKNPEPYINFFYKAKHLNSNNQYETTVRLEKQLGVYMSNFKSKI